ncbi:DUF3077 domain-containing protein [Pseudomonas sp. S60]|nr:DUF3077 domain-containing protein [Pseudomonas sp. S60]
MKKTNPDEITTAGIETFLPAGSPSLNLLRMCRF